MQRPKYSLLFLLLAVTYVAVMLGLYAYIEPRPDWRVLVWPPLIGPPVLCGFTYWLITSAPWGFRIFLLGLFLGASLEFGTMNYLAENEMVVYTPGVWTPEGWFPLSFPVHRILVNFGFCNFHDTMMPSIFVGMLVTGAVFGLLAFLCWVLIARRYRSIERLCR